MPRAPPVVFNTTTGGLVRGGRRDIITYVLHGLGAAEVVFELSRWLARNGSSSSNRSQVAQVAQEAPVGYHANWSRRAAHFLVIFWSFFGQSFGKALVVRPSV